jgi:hypothetical protein
MVSGYTKQNHQRMKDKLLSLKEIRKNWWWKRKEIRRDGVRGVDWPLVEESARNYELMRRSTKGKQFTQTYLELCREGKTIVSKLWVNWAQGAYRPVTNPSQFNEIGWTPVVSQYQHRQWNLRLADNLLIKEFIREIRLLREFQKIRLGHPLKGKKYRGVSWKLIEILDRKQNRIGEFNDSERHTLSDARRRAEKYFVEYERALAKWNEGSSSPDFDIEETDDSYPTKQPE